MSKQIMEYHLLEEHWTRNGRVREERGCFDNEQKALKKKQFMEYIREDCGYKYLIIDRPLTYSDMYPDD